MKENQYMIQEILLKCKSQPSKKAKETGGWGYILGKVNNKHVKSVKTPLKS